MVDAALKGLKDWEKPHCINTDKALPYGVAITELKAEGKLPPDTDHRRVKYLNNVVEADHGKLKQLIRPVRGFKTLHKRGDEAFSASPPLAPNRVQPGKSSDQRRRQNFALSEAKNVRPITS